MKKHKMVNWQDSMDVSASHFLQSDNFFLEAVADTAKLVITGYSFGLLPSHTGINAYNGIRVNEHISNHIEVQLHSCDAITRTGFRIRFNEDGSAAPIIKNYSPGEDKNIRNRDVKNWDIILAIDPFSRNTTGVLDTAETPPRHPDGEPVYSLYIMPVGDINTMQLDSHYLTIGRLRKDGERYVVDTNYIPPCASMMAHPELVDYYNNFGSLFHSIEKSAKNIIGKIHERSNKAELAINIDAICKDILKYIASFYFNFRNRGRYELPITIVNYVSTLAHVCYCSLTFLNIRQKEEMLKYFYEWTDISPGTFEEMLAETLDVIYEHDNIRAIMVRCELFLKNLEELLERLSRLEFIGQHKESIVVSERSQEREKAEGTRTWSILD